LELVPVPGPGGLRRSRFRPNSAAFELLLGCNVPPAKLDLTPFPGIFCSFFDQIFPCCNK
jgi:hypothetical protein